MNFKDRFKDNVIKCVLVFQIIVTLFFGFITSSIYSSTIKEQTKMIESMKDIQSKNTEKIVTLEEKLKSFSKEQNDNSNQIWNELDYLRTSEEDLRIMQLSVELSSLDNIEDKEQWFREYKEIIEKYDEYTGHPVSIYEAYTADEIYLIQRMVQTEVGSGDFESKVHVADVVWNRLEDQMWPDSITQIITSPNQFAYGATTISESTKLAVEYSYLFPDETHGALGFHSGAKSETFGRYKYLFTDKVGHHFYGNVYEE